MESLKQNKALLYSILGSGGVVLALTLGLVPELSAQFEIIDFPPDVSIFYDTSLIQNPYSSVFISNLIKTQNDPLFLIYQIICFVLF